MKTVYLLALIGLIILVTSPAKASFELLSSPEQKITALWSHEAQTTESRVMGFAQKDILSLDGDPNGSACSDQHKQNDLSNRWCHALFVKIANERLSKIGLTGVVSSILSASIFLPKEYMIDQKPSLADLVISEIELMEFSEKSGNLALSIFGDGAFVVSLYKTF